MTLVRQMLAASITDLQAERAARTTSFQPHKGGVMMNRGGSSVVLTPDQVSDLLGLYQREEAAAQAVVSRCHRLFNQLWDARCKALDAICERQPEDAN